MWDIRDQQSNGYSVSNNRFLLPDYSIPYIILILSLLLNTYVKADIPRPVVDLVDHGQKIYRRPGEGGGQAIGAGRPRPAAQLQRECWLFFVCCFMSKSSIVGILTMPFHFVKLFSQGSNNKCRGRVSRHGGCGGMTASGRMATA